MTYQYKTLTSAGSLAGTYEVLQLAYFVEPMAIWKISYLVFRLLLAIKMILGNIGGGTGKALLESEPSSISCEQSGIVVLPSLLLRIIRTQNTSNTLSIGEWQLRLVHHSPEPSPVTYTHAQHVSVHLGSYPSNFCRPAPFRQKDPGTRVWSQASQGQEESRPKPAGLALRKAREIESTREKEEKRDRKRVREN